MSLRRIVPFKITSMDSLGQGVSKETDRITFIPKTVIGDEGEAEVVAEKKGVAFAEAKTFQHTSELRQEPACPHFSQCPSCHYQHVSYESELQFKRQALEKLFHRLKSPPIEVIGASQRFEYRNRIQLHYDLKQKKMGMLDVKNQSILPIPHCIIGLPAVKAELERLYRQETWLKEAPQGSQRGHVELYWLGNELRRSWNRPYADGGFTQVFTEMNERLKLELHHWMAQQAPQGLLDLFAGNGNLSAGANSQRLCIDMYGKAREGEFLDQNLYAPNALRAVSKELRRRNFTPSCLILDPPRSGLKDLTAWLTEFKPKTVAYVSCDPHTLVRDLIAASDYEITKTFLIDFFPSTFHFETMVFLERKS